MKKILMSTIFIGIIVISTKAYATNETVTSLNKDNEETIQKDKSYVVNSKIDLKIIPSISSSNIASVEEGTTIQVKDTINKWCFVEDETQSGWTLKSKIINSNTTVAEVKEENKTEEIEDNTTSEENNEEKNDETESEQKKQEDNKQEEKKEEKKVTKYVLASNLNLREEPSSNANVIDQIGINETVIVTQTVDDTWSKVEYREKTGYVATKYLSDSKIPVSSRSENMARENANNKTNNETESNNKEVSNNETPAQEENTSKSSSGVSGSDIVAYAKQFLGCKYVYGGMSPSGFDCSGFTSYVYKHFGYSLNRTSSGQRSDGVGVEKSNLQPGDILCFSGHVGIYIGGGSFIHAANPSKGVITTSLSDSYYVKNYITARRIL